MVDPEKVKLAAELTVKFFDSAKAESDRGVVLIVVSMLDKLLGEIHLENIGKHTGASAKVIYGKMAEHSGPFSTLSGKIEIAYSYGLIGKVEHTHLTAMRKLRNLVAHDLAKFSFSDRDVEDSVSKLEIEAIAEGIAEFPLPSMEVVDLICTSMAHNLTTAPAGTYKTRARFIACGMLLHALLQKRKAHLPDSPASGEFVRPWEIEPESLSFSEPGDWFDTFWGNVLSETDRGMVLIVAMALEECVDQIHEAHLLRHFDNPERQFKKLSNQSGPLSSAASRILLAVGFGLIDEFVFFHLELVRVVRNHLAHEPGLFSFSSQGAAQVVAKMQYEELQKRVDRINSRLGRDRIATPIGREIAVQFAARHPKLKLVEEDAPMSTVSTFVLCGLSLNMLLGNRAIHLKTEALKAKKLI